jgi:hypothetical protein
MSSRRKFIFDCSTAVAAFSFLPMGSFCRPAVSGGSHRSLDDLSYPVFAAQINTLFRVRFSTLQTVELKLLKAPLAPSTPITPGRRLPGDAGYEKFSLIFVGEKHALLPSAIHRFAHEELGWFEMYIGQVGATDADDVRYEAGFNRPPPGACSFAKLT